MELYARVVIGDGLNCRRESGNFPDGLHFQTPSFQNDSGEKKAKKMYILPVSTGLKKISGQPGPRNDPDTTSGFVVHLSKHRI